MKKNILLVMLCMMFCLLTACGEREKAEKETSVNNTSQSTSELMVDKETTTDQKEDETTDKKESETEETSTEQETTTAKPEIETIDPSADPFTAEPEGTFVDSPYEMYVQLREYENGAKRYVYHSKSKDKDYEFSSIEAMPEDVVMDMIDQMYEDGVIVSVGVTSNGSSVTEPTTEKPTTPYVKPDVDEFTWIRQKYGDVIEWGVGDPFVFNAEWNTYVRKNDTYGCFEYHVMDSETTSKEVKVYRLEWLNIVQYAKSQGYETGKPQQVDDIIERDNNRYDENYHLFDIDVEENNLNYLDSIIVSKSNNAGRVEYWDYVTSHGLYIGLSAGYITMWVTNPGETQAQEQEFTIEEYYDFVNNKEYEVVTYDTEESFINGTFPARYMIVKLK